MPRFDYKKFNERYEKYQGNSLPTPFWDRERQVLEFVFYENDKYNVSNNLTDSFLEKFRFYYPYNSVIITSDGNRKVGQCHEHTFENVVRDLYNYPVSFNISKKDEIYYSKQELSYLKILKNYLLLIGLTDIPDNVKASRYRNKQAKKYQNAIILHLDNHHINEMLKGKCTFFAVKKNKSNKDIKKYDKGELQYLVVDNRNNFRLFIEYVEKKKQKYQEVKKQVKISKTKNDDDVMVFYFKIIEVFK